MKRVSESPHPVELQLSMEDARMVIAIELAAGYPAKVAIPPISKGTKQIQVPPPLKKTKHKDSTGPRVTRVLRRIAPRPSPEEITLSSSSDPSLQPPELPTSTPDPLFWLPTSSAPLAQPGCSLQVSPPNINPEFVNIKQEIMDAVPLAHPGCSLQPSRPNTYPEYVDIKQEINQEFVYIKQEPLDEEIPPTSLSFPHIDVNFIKEEVTEFNAELEPIRDPLSTEVIPHDVPPNCSPEKSENCDSQNSSESQNSVPVMKQKSHINILKRVKKSIDTDCELLAKSSESEEQIEVETLLVEEECITSREILIKPGVIKPDLKYKKKQYEKVSKLTAHTNNCCSDESTSVAINDDPSDLEFFTSRTIKPITSFEIPFVNNFRCKLCIISFRQFICMITHFNSKHHHWFKCQFCPTNNATNVYDLKNFDMHLRTSHLSTFRSSGNIDSYIIFKLQRMDFLTSTDCLLCDQVFVNEEHLEWHVNKSHRFCRVCGVVFSKEEDFKKHQEEHASGLIKSFVCCSCFLCFKTDMESKRHMDKFHNGLRVSCVQVAKLSTSGTVQNNACPYCPILLKKRSEIAGHMRGHSLVECCACRNISMVHESEESMCNVCPKNTDVVE